jgi:hypothetical protein
VPLDECGHVYEDLDAVLAVLEAEGIAHVAHRLYPVANLEGADRTEEDSGRGGGAKHLAARASEAMAVRRKDASVSLVGERQQA